MVSRYDKWIRIFEVPDTSQHKKGFTIYKITSMLYPEECPDAVTKITVWKRYNEFKKLHRDLKLKHRNLHLNDRFPALPNNPFFKRFDKDVINERREAILKFLDYVAKHPQLFTSNEFVKFFETSHTPNELLSGSINSIRADLHLPAEPEYVSFCSPNSDDERTLSDTDSISTLSSLSPSVQVVDLLSDPLHKSTTSLTRLSRKVSSDSCPRNMSVDLHDSVSIFTINEAVDDDDVFPTPPPTPSLSNAEVSTLYITDAAGYITRATEMELAKNYENAFAAYKAGIDVLLRNVKFDRDFDRKQLVRHKIEKYLLRAEKIYNLYLSPEMKNIQELTKVEREPELQRPLSDLYKYKVIKVIASGMLVIHSESQQLFYVKVIYKSWKFSSVDLIFPEDVPFMVKLYNYYNCENALFLILQYSCGVKITDYLKQKTNNNETFTKTNARVCSDVQLINSDDESEASYADLVSEYASAKSKDVRESVSQDLTVTRDEPSHLRRKDMLNFNDPVNVSGTKEDSVKDDVDSLEIGDLLTKSQKLLSAVDFTLNANESLASHSETVRLTQSLPPKRQNEVKRNGETRVERKLSDRSLYDDFDVQEHAIDLQDIVKWSAQLLLALEKLHVCGVICCDLNFNNLLINENGDLTLTYVCSLSQGKTYDNKTDLVVAPELYGFEGVTVAADWWSYGAVLYELLVGLSLNAVHPEGIFSYTNLKIPKFVAPEGRSLLKQLLAYVPHQRLGCGVNGTEDIKSHPFFSAISWKVVAASR